MANDSDTVEAKRGPRAAHDEEGDEPEAPGPIGRELGQALKSALDQTFWVFFILTIVAGAACWIIEGQAVFVDSLRGDLRLVVEIVPRIMAAVAIAALVQVLISRAAVARALGEEAGIRGVALATGAGAVTPGGPMTSFPVVNALHAAGGGRSALVAYLTSWSVLGFQRILTWEIPLLGPEFAAIRFVASLPLPFVAAAASKLIPPSSGERKTSGTRS